MGLNFWQEAGRAAARLILRRTVWLLVVVAVTFPVWHTTTVTWQR